MSQIAQTSQQCCRGCKRASHSQKIHGGGGGTSRPRVASCSVVGRPCCFISSWSLLYLPDTASTRNTELRSWEGIAFRSNACTNDDVEFAVCGSKHDLWLLLMMLCSSPDTLMCSMSRLPLDQFHHHRNTTTCRKGWSGCNSSRVERCSTSKESRRTTGLSESYQVDGAGRAIFVRVCDVPRTHHASESG